MPFIDIVTAAESICDSLKVITFIANTKQKQKKNIVRHGTFDFQGASHFFKEIFDIYGHLRYTDKYKVSSNTSITSTIKN